MNSSVPSRPLFLLCTLAFVLAFLGARKIGGQNPLPSGDLHLELTYTSISLTNGDVRIAISYFADSNHNYVVEFRDDLGQDLCNDWQPLPNAPHNFGIVFTTNATSQRYFRLRQIDEPRSSLFALLANDTGTNSVDRLTADPTITGLALRFAPGSVLRGSLDNPNGPFSTITNLDAPKYFLINSNKLFEINGGQVRDGPHVLYLRADAGPTAGANSLAFELPFNLDTTPPAVTVSLAQGSDSPPLGDNRTISNPVVLNGRTEPNQSWEILPSGIRVTADMNGFFSLTNIALAEGTNIFFLRGRDAACNEAILQFPICWYGPNCTFPDSLEGWSVSLAQASLPAVSQASNLQPVPGSVTVDTNKSCFATITEGDSFLVTLSRTFQLPTAASTLSFNYSLLSFDQTTEHKIKDAFEVALVDATGNPLAYTIADSRDSFFNATDDQPAALATDVTSAASIQGPASRITLSLHPSSLGQPATLTFRLVNNDQDSRTTVRISDVKFESVQLGAADVRRLAPVKPETSKVQPSLASYSAGALLRGATTSLTSIIKRQPMTTIAASLPDEFPVATNITVPPGFKVEVFAYVNNPTCLAFAPLGSSFGSNLFVGAGVLSEFSPQERDRIMTISQNGNPTEFTLLEGESDPVDLRFPPPDSPFGEFLYISANNRDGGRDGDAGGTIERVDVNKNVSSFTAMGLPDGPSEPGGIDFAPARSFGTNLYIGNSLDPPGNIMRIGPIGGAVNVFVGIAGLQVGPIRFGPGGPFGTDLYIGEFATGDGGCACIKTVNALGMTSAPLIVFTNRDEVAAIKFAQRAPFGDLLYAAVGKTNRFAVYTVDSNGTANEFASGFGRILGGLEFSPDGSALYVADYTFHRIYRITSSIGRVTIAINSPANLAAFVPNTTVLITGNSQTTGNRNSISLVTVNKRPVDALDSAGNFFTRVTIVPGQNMFTFTATDSFGQSATTNLTIIGVETQPTQIDFSNLSEVSASVVGEYGRTSYNEKSRTLYADLSVRNAGQYQIRAPIIVGIARISDASVRVLSADGTTPEGLPFFQVTDQLDTSSLTTGSLNTGVSPAFRTIAFSDPNEVQFTYELVILGQLNQAPVITSIPVIEGIAGNNYAYDGDAFDPDGDPIHFSAAQLPEFLTVNPKTGLLSGTPRTNNLGTHTIRFRVSDDHGAFTEQAYVLSIIAPPPNRPPLITSVPITAVRLPANPIAGGSIFLTGHDPDYHLAAHASHENPEGARRIIQTAIGYVMDPRFNPYVATGLRKFLFVESVEIPQGFFAGLKGIEGAGYTNDVTFDHHDFSSLNPALNELGSTYAAIVIASDYGGALRQQELDILNARAADIIGFLNKGGGLFAMAESNGGNLTPRGGRFGFLPFVVSSTPTNQSEIGNTITPFGSSLGLFANDVNGNFSHNVFNGTFGLSVVDYDAHGRILSLAGRGPINLQGIDAPYHYDVEANDPDNDALAYFLVVWPDGMTIDPVTGVIRWSPTVSQIGPHTVTVQVSDGRGGTNTQSYIVTVLSDPANHLPIIISQPVTNAVQDQVYTYDVDALDADDDPLTYSLIAAPTGMAINTTSGIITWLVPTNTPPQLGFAYAFGGSGQDSGRRVTVDSSGNVYVAGLFTGQVNFDPTGSTTLDSGASSAVFVAKYSPTGRLFWVRTTGSVGNAGAEQELIRGLATDGQDNVYIAGGFRGTVDFDPAPNTAAFRTAEDYDGFVWKLDSNGDFEWVRRIGGAENDQATGIAFDQNGRVNVVGFFQGTAYFPEGGANSVTSAGRSGLFAWALDTDGNFIWARQMSGANGNFHINDAAYVVPASMGSLYISGEFQGTVDFDPGSNEKLLISGAGGDLFVVKLDSRGDLVWAGQIGGSGHNIGGQLVLDEAGNLYIAGSFTDTTDFDPGTNTFALTSIARSTAGSNGSYDLFLTKWDGLGRFFWAKRIGAEGDDVANRIVLSGRADLYLVGNFQGVVDFDPGLGTNFVTASGNGGFVVRLDTDGNLRWATNLNTGPFDGATDCYGNIYIAGYVTTGSQDISLVKLTQNATCPTVTVRVEDGRGGFDAQSFVINVAASNIPPSIDLVIGNVDRSRLAVDPQTLAAAGEVSAIVTNLGPDRVSGPFNVLFFEDITHNGYYDAGIDNELGRTALVGGLAPGESATITAQLAGALTFPASFVSAFVDSSNSVMESNEGNNVARSEVHCQFVPPVGQFNPVVKWKKDTFSVAADFDQVMMTPAVVDLNSDGVPDVVFSTSFHGSYPGVLRAISGDNGSDLWTVTNADALVVAAAGVTVGDIDRDGRPDIVTTHETGVLIAFNQNGVVKWKSSTVLPGRDFWGSASLADLDHDGVPEIIYGAMVFNNDGTLRWDGTSAGGQGIAENQRFVGPISLVADLDLDGLPEIVAGKSAYHADGSLYWNSAIPDGFPAVGNFNSDPFPEVVVVSNGDVYLLDHTGALLWGPKPILGGGYGGAPTVADMDGDGVPEIGVAGADHYVVFSADGSLKWATPTRDGSSQETGSSVFDFDGDGKAEIVYGDELYLRIYRGSDGTVLYELPKSSGTAYELPLIVDVDGDGKAEIVAVANDYAFGSQHGIYVIGDANHTWVPTRQIWNQHTYHISNVNDDGSIPRYETNSWQTHNTYRLNLQTAPGGPLAAPDLVSCFVRAGMTILPTGLIGWWRGEGNTRDSAGTNHGVLTGDVVFEPGFLGQGFALNGVNATIEAPDSPELNPSDQITVEAWIKPQAFAGSGNNAIVDKGGWPSYQYHLGLTGNFYGGDKAEFSFSVGGSNTAFTNNAWQPGEWHHVVGTYDGSSVKLYVNGTLAASVGWTEKMYDNGRGLFIGSFADYPFGAFTPATIDEVAIYDRALPDAEVAAHFQAGRDGNCLQTLPVTARIANNGDLFTPPGINVAFYRGNPSNGGMLLGVAQTSTNLDPGTYEDVSLLISNCISVAELWVSVDDDGAAHGSVAECDENNNLFNSRLTPSGRGSISGVVFNDLNGNGVFQPSGETPEAGLADRVLYFDQNRNGQRDSDESFVLSDARGNYSFRNVTTGVYFLSEEPAAGWIQTAPPGGTRVVGLTANADLADVDFANVEAIGTTNSPPRFTSVPPTDAAVGQLYRYDAAAVDPNGDALSFDLNLHPAGMAVQSASGIVVWTPTAAQSGSHDVILRVQDRHGEVALQSFQIRVRPANTSPVITSRPSGPAFVATPWQYLVRAQDADGDTLTFQIEEGATNMLLSALSSSTNAVLLTWTPLPSQFGTHHVALTVSDGRDTTAQFFELPVILRATNSPPSITSAPRNNVRLGTTFYYLVEAADSDNDALIFSLGGTSPIGMGFTNSHLSTLNSQLLAWTPTAAQFGSNYVEIHVGDGQFTAIQSFSVFVTTSLTNQPPQIISRPPFAAVVGEDYAYDARASDPDGDPIIWALDTPPTGMSIEPAQGMIRWMPTLAQLGTNHVRLHALDGQGGTATQTYAVIVRTVNLPPQIVSIPLTRAATNQLYTYAARAEDPEGASLVFALTQNPTNMAISAENGVIEWVPLPSQLGTNAVTIRVQDDQGALGEQQFLIVVSDSAENHFPTITSTPPPAALVGSNYFYQIIANDSDGDVLRFQLLSGPSGILVDSTTGRLQWIPTLSEIGLKEITVAAIDPEGSGCSQTFTVAVFEDNRPPRIVSSPGLTVLGGSLYRYDVGATDPDDDAITYHVSGPNGMTIDSVVGSPGTELEFAL